MTVSVSANAIDADERIPKRLYGGVSYLLLVLSAALALALPAEDGDPSRLGTLGLVTLAAIWLVWPLVVVPVWPRRRVSILVFYVGLVAIVAVLIARSPAFALFGALGYGYALALLPSRLVIWGVTVTALLTALAQEAASSASAYVLASNIAVPLVFAGWYVGRQSEKRAKTVAELARTNQRLEAALAENTALQVQVVAQARQSGVVDERQRLALEIHDTIAQDLAGIVAQLRAVDVSTDSPAALRRRVDAAAQLARDGLSQARRSVSALRPEVLETSRLPEALEHVVRQWSRRSDVPAELAVTGDPKPVHPDIEVALLRIGQEALSNVAKHAEASRVGLTLSYLDDVVILDVRDDGHGFDPAKAAQSGEGFGLTGMRQRLDGVGGTLVVESEPGAGATVSARVPAVAPDQSPR